MLLLTLFAMAPAIAQQTPSQTLAVLDPIIQAAIQNHEVPGAVLLVGHDGQVIYRKAFGNRSLEPARAPMTVDTIFDIASLTKVVATTTAVMQLVEKGKLRLNDPVVKYIPEFAQNGKVDITVRDLLTHYSGLPPDLDLTHTWEGRDVGYSMAFASTPIAPPETRFIYSDVNFIVLAAIIERVSGQPLDCLLRAKYFYSTRNVAHALSPARGLAEANRTDSVRRAQADAPRCRPRPHRSPHGRHLRTSRLVLNGR